MWIYFYVYTLRCTLDGISVVVELKSTVLAENAEGSHCHHCRQGEPGCGGGGATGLIVMTYALPQSLTVYHFVSLSHRTAKLPSISPPSFSSLLLHTSFVCMCTSLVCFHIFQCEIFFFLPVQTEMCNILKSHFHS